MGSNQWGQTRLILLFLGGKLVSRHFLADCHGSPSNQWGQTPLIITFYSAKLVVILFLANYHGTLTALRHHWSSATRHYSRQ